MKNDNSIPLTTAQGWAKTWVNSQPAGAGRHRHQDTGDT